MQAIERIITNNNWITIVIIFAIVVLAYIKLLKPNKLRSYAFAFFTPSFIKKKVDDNTSFNSTFHIFLFIFSTITISLFLFLLIKPEIYKHNFLNYILTLSTVTIFFTVKYLLDFSLSNILGATYATKYFVSSKIGYLNSLSLWLFPVIIIYQYAFTNSLFLLVSFGILFIFRAFLILFNNKKIVIHKLFYFILYFCTLEIAPLLIVYKITTTT
ncbi:DUF4271 domain-containing protein [Tenacibaculum aestuariivivum]|uniref:DUF4271 domain-containing protein n=1 Tax=Tenacibaculum aestuariivivum TaxID=2006131 RepID=UPI003AB2E22B